MNEAKCYFHKKNFYIWGKFHQKVVSGQILPKKKSANDKLRNKVKQNQL